MADGRRQERQPEIIIPQDIVDILNPEIDKMEIQNFLTCFCFRRKYLYKISDNMIQFRCSCGAEFAYPICHHYFIIKQKPDTELARAQEVPTVKPTETRKPATGCTCSKCQGTITTLQSQKSLEFIGRALCEGCLGKELVCQ